ncbi:unnamed protein product [Sympodiomycopsis kandeliae]
MKAVSEANTAELQPRAVGFNKDIKMSKRRYLSSTSYEMPKRSSISRGDAFALLTKKVEEAGSHPHCELCGVELTFHRDRHDSPKDQDSRCIEPSNLSPDARVPRCRGGQYTDSNTALLCTACNFVKCALDEEAAQKLLHKLATEQNFTVEDGLMVPSPRPVLTTLTDDDRELISAWAEKAIKRVERSSQSTKKKEGMAHDLSKEDLIKMAKEVYVGLGNYLDPSSVVLPLSSLTSVDRIDSSKGYTRDNCRLLLWGLNNLKSDCHGDAAIVEYLESLARSIRFGDIVDQQFSANCIPADIDDALRIEETNSRNPEDSRSDFSSEDNGSDDEWFDGDS